jgi:UDP-GlcNAc:undecaprenyl-phosphate GlcNAc-1-phosphate transferase
MIFTPNMLILPILAALVTFFTMPLVRKLSLKVGAVALPGGRRPHKDITPMSGGIAIFVGFLIAILFLNNTSSELLGFLVGASIIVAMGFIDDIFELPAIAKFFGQIIATLIVISAGVRIELIGNMGNGNDGIYYLGFLSLPLTFFWIIGITNAVNFIDGLDGLAGGVCSIAAITLGIVALVSGRTEVAIMCFTLGASALAFLPHNFTNSQKHKIFMGDCGSGFLGFSLAVFSIVGATKVAAVFSMLVPIIILAIPIFDTGFAIIRRLAAGKSPFAADKMHLHHRLMDKGLSSKQTVIFIYVITAILGVIAVLSMYIEDKYIPYIFAATAISFVIFLWKMGLIKIERKSSKG